MGFLIFLGIVIGIVVCFMVASEFAEIANKKGYDGAKYFWYTFFLGIIGALMVIALPNRNSNINIVHNTSHTDKENNGDNIHSVTKNVIPNTVENSNDTKSVLEPDVPSQEKKATFKTTENNTIICSSCGFEQPEGRRVCWRCGSKFCNEDEANR